MIPQKELRPKRFETRYRQWPKRIWAWKGSIVRGCGAGHVPEKENQPMIHFGKETPRSSQQVLDQALAYFGPEGVGLTVERQAADGIGF